MGNTFLFSLEERGRELGRFRPLACRGQSDICRASYYGRRSSAVTRAVTELICCCKAVEFPSEVSRRARSAIKRPRRKSGECRRFVRSPSFLSKASLNSLAVSPAEAVGRPR